MTDSAGLACQYQLSGALLALQVATVGRVQGNPVVAQVIAHMLGLALTQFGQFVVIIRAKRGLAVANEVNCIFANSVVTEFLTKLCS